MKYKAVLFDFDGLMFDTEKVWQTYNNKANEVFNINFTEEDRGKIAGKREPEIREILKRLFPTLDVDSYREWLRSHVFSHQINGDVKAKLGLFELLAFIKEHNLFSAIVTGSDLIVVKNLLNKSNIDLNDFKTIISGDLDIKTKPAPDVYLLACEKIGIKPEEAIVLEDSHNGVRAGKSAGCFTIMIPDTMKLTEEIKQVADLVLNDLNEVVDFLKDKV